jgi:hypothetical protein
LFINGTPSPALTAAPQIPTHHPVPFCSIPFPPVSLIFSQIANMLILAIILCMKLYGSFTLAKIVGKTVSERNIWQRHTKTHPGHIRHHDTGRSISISFASLKVAKEGTILLFYVRPFRQLTTL